MLARRASLSAMTLAAPLLTVVGCDSSGSQPEKTSTFTEQLRQVTNETPSFAGINFDGDAAELENFVVYLFNGEKRGAAQETLQGIFGEQASGFELRTRDEQGGASVGLVDKADGVIELEEVVGVGFGENSYLFVTVSGAEGIKRAKDQLQEVGISLDKVAFRTGSMPVAY